MASPHPHTGDEAGIYQDSLMGLRRATGAIDERYVRECELRRRLRRWPGWHDEERHEQQEENLSKPQGNAHLPGNDAFLESYHKPRQAAGLLGVCRRGRRRFGEALVSVMQSR